MIHLGEDGQTVIVHCDVEKEDSPTGYCRCTVDIAMNDLKLPDPHARVHILGTLRERGWMRQIVLHEGGMKAHDICPCDVPEMKKAWTDKPHVNL